MEIDETKLPEMPGSCMPIPDPISDPSLRPSNLALPYGMTLSRYANKAIVELIGKYKVAPNDSEPTRVCRVIVDKAERKAVIDINGDEKLIVEAACGTPSMLEYCAVKALKGYLQFRIAFNAHKVRQRKRRRAEKRAKPAAEAESCE